MSETESKTDEWAAGLAARAKEWSEERAVLVEDRRQRLAEIAPITTKINDLDSQIAAAMLVSPVVADAFFEADAANGSTALPEALLQALKIPPIPTPGITREQIKQRLPMVKYDIGKLQANQNLLYIALRQMVERKQVEEKGSRFRLVESGGAAVAAQSIKEGIENGSIKLTGDATITVRD